MQKSFTYLAGMALTIAACTGTPKQPATQDATTGKTDDGNSCYFSNLGQDTTAVQITLTADKASGYLAWEPYEKDGARGKFEGERSGAYVHAQFTYMIEGAIQSEEMVLKMDGNRLYQGNYRDPEAHQAFPPADADIDWRDTLMKTDCSRVQAAVQRATDVYDMIQKEQKQ